MENEVNAWKRIWNFAQSSATLYQLLTFPELGV